MNRFLFLAALFLPGSAYAATVSETVTYVMADSDTKAVAREACVAQAGRNALIESGSIVDSDMEIIRSEAMGKFIQRADQRVRSYVGGIVKSQVTAERWDTDNGKISVTCTVNVTFDPAAVHDFLAQVSTAIQKKQVDRMATAVDGDDVLAQIDALTAKAKKVRHGMTYQEVLDYLGPWRAKDTSQNEINWYNWGGVWIAIGRGVVKYVSPYPAPAWASKFDDVGKGYQ